MITLEAPLVAPRQVAFDLYRDIHKAIRTELFLVTTSAGSQDPSDGIGRAALARHVDDVIALLVAHAEHEDLAIHPALERHVPDLAAQMESEHHALDARMNDLRGLAHEAAARTRDDARFPLHRLYLELAAFTTSYLSHQDNEERVVMPALEVAIGVDAVVGINQAIVSSIPPDEMMKSLALMLPAMNVDDRTELLGGMQAGAPAEAFEAVWGLAGSVLVPRDMAELAARLGRG